MARAWMSWSSGKDSAMALHVALRDPQLQVTGLLTTLNSSADRVAMHAVRRTLLQAQADRLGLPLHVVELPWPCPNDVYEQRMRAAVDAAAADGVTHMVFGDLFLDDIRTYREGALAGTGITPLFPLWRRPTAALARDMLDAGIKAVLTCVDPAQAPPAIVGRHFDHALLDELPAEVDPCGERGEFHTFVHDGPDFSAPIPIAVGEVVDRDGFRFADVVPV